MRIFKIYYFGSMYVGDFAPPVHDLLVNKNMFLSEFAAKEFLNTRPKEIGSFFNYATGEYQKDAWWMEELSEKEFLDILVSQDIYKYPTWPLPMTNFVFADPEDTSLVHYWDGRRVVSMKPGRYLNRFHKNLNKVQVEYYARWWIDRTRPPREITGTVNFAITEEEMIDVYSRGPESCMLGREAVRAYAGGDFAIAYLEMDSGEVGARVLVNTVTKTFGRIYPEGEEGDDLEELLRSNEYQSLEENEDGFEGARFLKIPLPQNETEEGETVSSEYDAWVMPYLDRGVYIDARTWTATRKPDRMYRLSSDSTQGYMATNGAHCAVCGEPSLVQSYNQYVKHEDYGDNAALCPLHRETEKYMDALTGTHIYGRPTYISPSGLKYSKSTIASNLYVSAHSGQWFLEFEEHSVRVDGDRIAASEAIDFGATFNERYQIWTKKSAQELRDEYEPRYIKQKASEAYWEARDAERWFYDRQWDEERGNRPPPAGNVEVQATRRIGDGGYIHREIPLVSLDLPVFRRISARYE